MPLLNLFADHHVRTLFADGGDPPERMVWAAEQAGLTSVGFTDTVTAASTWLPAYRAAIDRIRSRTPIRLYSGVATEILTSTGRLDLPAELDGIEHVAVASRGLPLATGLAAGPDVRAQLASGSLRPREVAGILADTYASALENAARHAQAVLARPFGILPELGLSEDDIDDDALRVLIDGCRAAGAMVEVDEKWRCPSLRVARALVEGNVRLVAASNGQLARDTGAWNYVRTIAGSLPVSAEPGL